MSFAAFLSIFVAAYMLVIPAYLILRGFAMFHLPASVELRLHYFALGLIVVLSLAQPMVPHAFDFQPTVKVFSAPTNSNGVAISSSDFVNVGYGKESAKVEARYISALWWFLGMMVLGFSAARMGSDFWNLRHLRRKSFVIRKIGQVKVMVSSDILVPFSYRTWFYAYVVIPSRMLTNREDFRIALSHEIQHHRQGDTAWIYLMWILRSIFIIHPIFYFWNRWLLELQEFACDEALLDHGSVSSHAYALCLVETAENAFYQERPPACATGLMFLVERHLISRRIEKMFSQKVKKNSRAVGFGAMVALALAMTTTAYATKGVVQDRRVSMADAHAMLKQASVKSDFPLVVNDLVLRELNYFIGTEEGRQNMREALSNMEGYRAMIESNIARYGLPSELLAIPIVESRYRNLEEDGVKGHGAGLWMFIKSTARNYGLIVDKESGRDDRLVPALETVAAMQYLGSNNRLFNNWLLAIFAYNVGEKSVENAIDDLGTHDVWTLIRKGYENDQRYLAKVMAAILIMKNPDSVK